MAVADNFVYREYEGKKTPPQVCVRDDIRRQQERNTQQVQATQRKKFYEKTAGAKAHSVAD